MLESEKHYREAERLLGGDQMDITAGIGHAILSLVALGIEERDRSLPLLVVPGDKP